MEDVFVKQVPIELMKFLKLANFVDTGGMAKNVISDKLVKVNGMVETRLRKKLSVGDVIDFQGMKATVVSDSSA